MTITYVHSEDDPWFSTTVNKQKTTAIALAKVTEFM